MDATKLVAGGSDQFGIAGGDQLLVARSKGLPVVAIAALMQETPAGFMVHADSDIRGMEDFGGKRIRVVPGHNTEIAYRAAMHRLGVDTSTIREVVNFTALRLLVDRKVDIEPIYVNNQPPIARAQGVEFRVLRPIDAGVRSYGNVYFTTEHMIRERPELVQRFLEGLLRGWEGAFGDPEKAVDTLLGFAPALKKDIEMDKLKATTPLMERSDGRIGWMERERWTAIWDMLQDAGVIKPDAKVDVDRVFDMKFITGYYE